MKGGITVKRLLVACVVLCVCFALAACTASDPDNLFEVTTLDAAGTIAAGTERTEPNLQTAPMDSVDYEALEPVYQYGNMQKGGGFMRIGKHVLFTFLQDGNNRLFAYDLTTGKVRLWCDDATCTHGDCKAGGILFGLEVYGGKIYVTAGNFQVTEITDTEKVPVTAGQSFGFCHHDNCLYLKTGDSSLAMLEEGSDKARILIDEYTKDNHVVFGNYLYATSYDSLSRIDITAAEPKEEMLLANASAVTNGQHIYYVDMATNFLFRCAMDGTGAELLLDQPVHFVGINFDEEYFYFRFFTSEKNSFNEDSYDLYRFPMNDPARIEKIATLPAPIANIFTVPGTGKLFVTVYERSNGEQDDIYALNTDGSNITRLEIPEY